MEETISPYHKILKGKTALYELTDEEMSTMARCLPDELGNMSPLDKAVIGLKILVRSLLLTKRVISVLLSFGYSRGEILRLVGRHGSREMSKGHEGRPTPAPCGG